MPDEFEQLKYPIGSFQLPGIIDEKQIAEWIAKIENLPARVRIEVEGLTEDQLEAVYRPEGWNIKQIVHHLPDSHMNAYIRFKLALTEENAVIRPYHEGLWAELSDAKLAPIAISLNLLASLHTRWCLFLKSLSPADLNRSYIHPEHQRKFILKEVIGLYAWHGEHHLAHIRVAKQRSGFN